MKIYIDADACPVQNETIRLAEDHGLNVVLVKSYSHYSFEILPPFVQVVYVDKGKEMADMKILSLISKGDLVITQDYGLAALCLGKGVKALHHKGFFYTKDNIDRLLAIRHASQMARNAGQRTKGPKAFTDEDRVNFSHSLEKFLNTVNF